MSNIDDAVAAYIAASDVINPAPLVGLKAQLETRALVQATQAVGRAASAVRQGGGAWEAPTLLKLAVLGNKLNQAYSHYAQLNTLLDELVPEFMGMQGELAGIAAQISATGA